MTQEHDVMLAADAETARDVVVTEQTINLQKLNMQQEPPLESIPAAEVPALPPPPVSTSPSATSTPPIPPDPTVKTEDDKDGTETVVEETAAAPANGNGKPSKAEIMVAIAKMHATLFHTPDGEAFASIWVNGHFENVKIRSQDFRQWLGRGFDNETGKTAGAIATMDAIQVLEAVATNTRGKGCPCGYLCRWALLPYCILRQKRNLPKTDPPKNPPGSFQGGQTM